MIKQIIEDAVAEASADHPEYSCDEREEFERIYRCGMKKAFAIMFEMTLYENVTFDLMAQ